MYCTLKAFSPLQPVIENQRIKRENFKDFSSLYMYSPGPIRARAWNRKLGPVRAHFDKLNSLVSLIETNLGPLRAHICFVTNPRTKLSNLSQSSLSRHTVSPYCLLKMLYQGHVTNLLH